MVESTSQPTTPSQLKKLDSSAWKAIQTKNCLPFSKSKKKCALRAQSDAIWTKRVIVTENLIQADQVPLLENVRHDSITEDSVFRNKESIAMDTQRSIIQVRRGSITLDTLKPEMKQSPPQVTLDQSMIQHQLNQSRSNPSGASSARNANAGVNLQLSLQQHACNILGLADWQSMGSSEDVGPGGSCNIFSQLLQKQYVQVLQNERQRQQYQEPSQITAQVIAALRDPAIKNKNKFISKIVDGIPANTSLSDASLNVNGTVNGIAAYITLGRKSKQRSRAITQNSIHRKGTRDINNSIDERSRHIYEPLQLPRQQGSADSPMTSKGRPSYPGEGNLTFSQMALQIQNKKIIPKNRVAKTGSFQIRMAQLIHDRNSNSVEKGCGSEDDVFSSNTNNDQIGSVQSADISQTRLGYPMPSRFKEGISRDHTPTKVMVAIDKKSYRMRGSNTIMRPKQFLIHKQHLLDSKQKIDGHVLSPLSEKVDNFDITYTGEAATTLLNGSEANNQDVSHIGTESPFLLSSKMKKSRDVDKAPSTKNSPLRKAKKSAVAENHQTPFLLNQLKDAGRNVRRRMTASFDKNYLSSAQRLHDLSIHEKQRAVMKACMQNLDIETDEVPEDLCSINDRSEDKHGQTGDDIMNDSSFLPQHNSSRESTSRPVKLQQANLTTETPQLDNKDLLPSKKQLKHMKVVEGAGGDQINNRFTPCSSGDDSTVKAVSQMVEKTNEQDQRQSKENQSDLLQPIKSPGAFTIVHPANITNQSGSANNSQTSMQKVIAKSTVFSFNSVPDAYKEDSKNVPSQNRICRAYFNASKHNIKTRDDSIKKVQKNHRTDNLERLFSQKESSNSNGDLGSADVKIQLGMVGSDAMVQADVGTSPMGSFFDGASSSAIELMSNQQFYAGNGVITKDLESFFSVNANESNTHNSFARTMPIKVSEMQHNVCPGNQLGQRGSLRPDSNQQTQQLLLNPLPIGPNAAYPGISQLHQQQLAQQQAAGTEQIIQHAQELHKISEGVFSSEQSCNSPMASHLKPNYSQRPVTQSKPRIIQKAQQHTRRMILLENGEVEPASPQIDLIQNQYSVAPECLCASANQKAEGQNLCQSNIFQLNSVMNDKSAFEESELNLCNADGNIHDGSLQQLVQPDFIKRIGVTKNGEAFQPQAPGGTKPQKKKKSRLGQRIECQQQRVQPSFQVNSGMGSCLRSPQPRPELQNFQPACLTNVPQLQHILSPQQSLNNNQPLNQLRLEKYHQRHDQRKGKLPPSFMKQKMHYQAYNEQNRKSIEDSDSQQAFLTKSHENSIYNQPLSDEDQCVYDNGRASIPAVKNIHTINESSVDFDINELQRLEQLKPIGSRMLKQDEDHFKYAQALPPKAFNIGITNVGKAREKQPGLESFIPALKHGVHRNSGMKELMKPSEQFANSHPVSPPNGQLRQIQFEPFEGYEESMITTRKSQLLGMNTVRNSFFGGFNQSKMGQDRQSLQHDRFDKVSRKFMNRTSADPYSKTPKHGFIEINTNRRYQASPNEPMQLLSLGKQVNLAKQNRRKQLLSMENRRLCGQEDRIFNERMKMVNMKMTLTQLPRVRRKDASILTRSTMNPLTSKATGEENHIDNELRVETPELTTVTPSSVMNMQSQLRSKGISTEEDRNQEQGVVEQTPALVEHKIDDN